MNPVHTLSDEWICEKHSERIFKYLSPFFPRYRDRISVLKLRIRKKESLSFKLLNQGGTTMSIVPFVDDRLFLLPSASLPEAEKEK